MARRHSQFWKHFELLISRSVTRAKFPAEKASARPWREPWSPILLCPASRRTAGRARRRHQGQDHRRSARTGIRLHRIPILYVTHSREEVFALGERVLVLDAGRIVAQGTPHEVIEAPQQETVAQLVGFENIFDAIVEAVHPERGTMTCRVPGDGAPVVLETPLVRGGVGSTLRVGIRAGDILAGNSVPGRTERTQRYPRAHHATRTARCDRHRAREVQGRDGSSSHAGRARFTATRAGTRGLAGDQDALVPLDAELRASRQSHGRVLNFFLLHLNHRNPLPLAFF